MTSRVALTFVAIALTLPSGVARLRAQTTSAPAQPAHTTPNTIALLDQYARGDFGRVTTTLERIESFDVLLKDLETGGAAWIAAGHDRDRMRRTLAAATFALEAARIGEWKKWKTIQIVQIQDVKYHITLWDPPALLVEWGCALFRQERTTSEQEHLWQLAAMAVAERAEDFEFLVGYRIPPPFFLPKPIDHVKHAVDRFPHEQRFQLAYGIANEWADPPTARASFRAILNNVDSGGEATVRLGAMSVRSGNAEAALALLDTVEGLTRDPWVVYLAHYFAGQASEQLDRRDAALAHYRRALATVPRAQAASTALASLLFRTGERTEAASIIEAMLASDPVAPDPWRGYADADDRFWPALIAALHKAIAG